TMSNQGWTITADPAQSTLSIANKGLGVILQNVRINLDSEHALHPLTGWSVEQTNQSLLTIRTSHPIAAFAFEVSGSVLKISSTYSNAVLTAQAPAPLSRIPARLLDTKGFPVVWSGTNEA